MVTDREFMDEAAKGLKIEEMPFKPLAEKLGMTEAEVIERIARLIDEGKVRRFAASVRHQPIGYSYNAMVMSRVEPEKMDDVGMTASGLDPVSHCYQRAHPDGDPNTIYIMVHGTEKETVDGAVRTIKELAGVRSVEVCASAGELKKTSLSGVTTDLDNLD